ncbi:MAG: DegT/DnrJ/EryC1/StrS family aminotransferase [Candidatus Thermoplasmatota archaeon]
MATSPKATPQPLHVGRPNLGSFATFSRLAKGIWESKWLTNNGPLVQRFETELQRRLKVKHAIAVSNATIGIELAAKATGMKGDVLVPAFTFVATAHALEWIGLRPVLCDVNAETHNLDPAAAESRITKRTGGILGVHLWGRPCDIRGLQRVADDAGVPLAFDAAHAFGSRYGGRPIGSFGAAEVFSFHATKFLNTAEGGAVTTNDDEVAERLRLLRNFGFAGYDNVQSLGTNAKMNELTAALGLTNLKSVASFVKRNRANHALYCKLLANLPGLEVVRYDPAEQGNFQYVVCDIDPKKANVDRDSLVEALWRQGILARRYFAPGVHRMQPYARRRHAPLPATDRLATRLLALPNGMSMGPAEVRRVCRTFVSILDGRNN